MAKAITAYVSDDGKVHTSMEEAEFADYTGHLTGDIRDFIAKEQLADKNGDIARVICKWDLWRQGGYDGWLAGRAAPTTAPAPTAPAAPALVKKAPAAEPERSPFRRRIAVVGIPTVHHRAIDREFGDEFKLTLIDTHDMSKLEGLKSQHKVIVMSKWAHLKTIEVLRRIGQEPLIVHGALDVLRTTLTDLYLADQAA
jgi:hypothetical protein